MRRMSRQAAPGKGLFEDPEFQAEQKPVSKVVNYLDRNLSFTTHNEKIKMLSEFTGRKLDSYSDLSRNEAGEFLIEAENKGDQFREDLLNEISYNRLTASQKRVTETGYIKGKGEEVYDYLREGPYTGIDISKGDAGWTEWQEGVPWAVRMQVTNTETGSGLDEVAEHFNMTEDQLIDALKNVEYQKEREESTFEEAEKERIKKHQREEAEEERNKPKYRVEVSGEPTLEDPAAKVQKIYGKLLEKLTGDNRSELMNEAWRIWYDWSGYNRKEAEEVVPFMLPAKNKSYSHQFYVDWPKEEDLWNKEKRENLEDRLSEAMEYAHKIYNKEVDTFNRAVEKGLKKYELYEPMEWVSTRAHEINQDQGLSYEKSFEKAYMEWARGG